MAIKVKKLASFSNAESPSSLLVDEGTDKTKVLPGNVIEFAPANAAANNGKPHWWNTLELRKDKPINNLANALVFLRNDDAIKNAFACDQMSLAVVVKQPLPGEDVWEPEFAERQLSDLDITRAQEYLQKSGLSQVGRDVVSHAIDARAHECAFHPVRSYLDGLHWDETPRLNSWLATYLGATGNPYTEGVGVMFFIAMVARIYRPGCKHDYTLILEAEQGAEKSTACRIIGKQWFSDCFPDVSGKDAAQHLAGKWLVELGELSVLGKWESESLKAFLTRQEDKYRPPYARNEIIQKRQCVFIGTTNKTVYLKDTTGGRRFWPVAVGKISNAALAQDLDQLYAEAVARYKKNEPWYPDAHFEKTHIRLEQEARFEADTWEDDIREYLIEKKTRSGQRGPSSARRRD